MNTADNVTLAARQMESIKFDNLLINFTTEFQRIWDSKGSNSKPGSFWRPAPAPDLLPGFFPLGDVATVGRDSINEKRVVAVVCEADSPSADHTKGKALRPPDDFEQIWNDTGSRARADCSIWRPIPPEGYVALGLVCFNGNDKPSLNAVRCVRADLVIPSRINDLIWNDKGSHAKQDFSAWSISPPAAAAGEIYLAPGTFIGINSYTKPTTHVAAYSLRMQIPLQVTSPPMAPALSGNGSPSPVETAKTTHVAKLPWFTIKDRYLNPLVQLRTSPFYFMERTDQYELVGYGHNEKNVSQTFKWTAYRVQDRFSREEFSSKTSIEIERQWSNHTQASLISFSAKLDRRFAHTDAVNGWSDSAAVDVVAIAQKNRTVAVYQMLSNYRLLRGNGTQVANDVGYTDSNNLYLTEYPPENERENTETQLPMEASPTPTDTAP
jgi:hypothetical protein